MPIPRKINKDFFKTWSSDMAYVLGFLFADGNIIKTKRGTWFWSIKITDKGILKSIKNTLKSNHSISVIPKTKNYKTQYRLQIGSKDMCRDLLFLGLLPAKSRKMFFPVVPKIYMMDFIRGYFDGDGGVWLGDVNKNRKKPISVLSVYFTSGSERFLKELFCILKVMGLRGGSLVKKSRGFELKYSTRDSLILYENMYNSNSPMFLTRKRAIFDKFIYMRS